MTDDELRDQIARALLSLPGWELRAYDRVDVLLPVVRAYGDQRAAQALTDAAPAAHCAGDYHRLLSRANALSHPTSDETPTQSVLVTPHRHHNAPSATERADQ